MVTLLHKQAMFVTLLTKHVKYTTSRYSVNILHFFSKVLKMSEYIL